MGHLSQGIAIKVYMPGYLLSNFECSINYGNSCFLDLENWEFCHHIVRIRLLNYVNSPINKN